MSFAAFPARSTRRLCLSPHPALPCRGIRPGPTSHHCTAVGVPAVPRGMGLPVSPRPGWLGAEPSVSPWTHSQPRQHEGTFAASSSSHGPPRGTPTASFPPQAAQGTLCPLDISEGDGDNKPLDGCPCRQRAPFSSQIFQFPSQNSGRAGPGVTLHPPPGHQNKTRMKEPKNGC